jgi:hypothetical protein
MTGTSKWAAAIFMTEWVPAAETVDDWSQMLTVQVYRRGPPHFA